MRQLVAPRVGTEPFVEAPRSDWKAQPLGSLADAGQPQPTEQEHSAGAGAAPARPPVRMTSDALVEQKPNSLAKLKKKKKQQLTPLDRFGKPIKKTTFNKQELQDAVRKLAPGFNEMPRIPHEFGQAFNVTNVDAQTKAAKGGQMQGLTPLDMMEWGVNFAAKKFNEIRTQCDAKAVELKKKLDKLRDLKAQNDGVEDLLKPENPYSVTINTLIAKIKVVQDNSDRELHYRRQLEHVKERLEVTQIKFDCHVGHLQEARDAALREHADMVAMTRQIEASLQGLLVEVHEKEYEMEVEGEEMQRSLDQREAEKAQAAKMKGWDEERKRERAMFNAEMAGDLTKEGEQELMGKLNSKKAELRALRGEHDRLEKEFNELDEGFSSIRSATGAYSLAEVVEKIKEQKENKKQLVIEKREADGRLAGAKQAREKLEKRFTDLRASGIGTTEMTRDVADDLEGDITTARTQLNSTTQDCERLEGTLIGLRTGAVGLYERLVPYFDLLDEQPELKKKGPPDAKTIETAEAIVLSEALLVKMIELLGQGEKDALVIAEPVEDLNMTLAPGNNLRIRSEEQTRETTFITAGALDEDEADDGLAAQADPTQIVPGRSFIKKSAARQSEAALRTAQEAKRAKNLEELSEGPGATQGSKAARKKAQDENLRRISQPINNLHPPPMSKVKGSAVGRASELVRDFPKFG